MKLFILILGSLDALFLIGAFIVTIIGAQRTDHAGQGIMHAYAVGMLLIFLIFVLPSLLLTYYDQSLWLPLILMIIATLLVIFLIYVW